MDWIKDSLIARGRGRSRKALDKNIKMDLDLNSFSKDLVYEEAHWCCLTHAADCT